VNIEAYNSFLHFEEIAMKAEDFALLYYISMLEVIHFLRIFNSVSGKYNNKRDSFLWD